MGKEVDKKADAKKGKENADGNAKDAKDKKAPVVEKKKILTYSEDVRVSLDLLYAGVLSKDQRKINRAIRNVTVLRHKVQQGTNNQVLAKYIELLFVGNPMQAVLLQNLGVKVEKEAVADVPDHKYQGDTAVEVEVYLAVLVLALLIDTKQISKAVAVGDAAVERLKVFNRRTLDQIGAKVFFLFSRAYELSDKLADIRQELLNAYRSACLHHDMTGQANLLNLLLRNYLHYNLYDLALKLVSKTSFPENLRSNAQYARYLYYLGRIKAVQLEYSEAHSKLMQAIRKAPQGPNTALGFRLAAQKLAIVVELLMGDIPDRQTFNQKELKKPLLPYQALVMAVRSGDLTAFKAAMDRHEETLQRDGTLCLIRRLHHSVIKTGLRMIHLSYSRITLGDICKKLGLESPADAEGVVSKAILDGVIDATIDHEKQFLESKATADVYASDEPLKALHKRISFCLQMHNDAVKAMTYPDETKDAVKEAEEQRLRHLEAVQRAEEAEADGDDDMI